MIKKPYYNHTILYRKTQEIIWKFFKKPKFLWIYHILSQKYVLRRFFSGPKYPFKCFIWNLSADNDVSRETINIGCAYTNYVIKNVPYETFLNPLPHITEINTWSDLCANKQQCKHKCLFEDQHVFYFAFERQTDN